MEALAAAEPDSPLAHLLLARWELRLDMNASLAESVERLTRAIAHYHNAAELAPQDPRIPYRDLNFTSGPTYPNP